MSRIADEVGIDLGYGETLGDGYPKSALLVFADSPIKGGEEILITQQPGKVSSIALREDRLSR